MAPGPRKISIAQCVRQGDTILTFYCVTYDPSKYRYGGGPSVCGHQGTMPVNRAIEIWGADARLSELVGLTCSVCRGRDIEVRAEPSTNPQGRRF